MTIRYIVDHCIRNFQAKGGKLHYEDIRILGLYRPYDDLIVLSKKLWGQMHDFVLLHEYMHFVQHHDANYVRKDNRSHEYDCDRRVVNYLLAYRQYESAEEYANIVYEHRGFDFREKAKLSRARAAFPAVSEARSYEPQEVLS